MGRKPCCPYCKEAIEDKEIAIKKSNKYYHKECYEQVQAEKEANKSEYEKLIDYIYKLYDKQIPAFVFKQIKDYVNEYGMKHSGILRTLKYVYEELEIPFNEENGIGIVLYKYLEAKNEYLKQKEINKAIDSFEFEDKVVVINKRFSESINTKYKEIDIGEL